eukprot:CAMPEP_0201554656 /NCGR_PEP_ID=MMETSP0173_2-20130828/42982_1 /ASSEMBLY_ACC=CAM_ASM_000268 /TAXON_ID=218659 /ORGANISM="Vexillifera sp., Strain DIVA3 564/2" /LENGTH=445 /DNA_ID=CAMNT_0047966031 /DNA_START=29 /DNA_END=1362 /DNA_ORIENTATION=+
MSKEPKKYYAVDFTFGEVIGEGAFGAVMKATLNESGKDYAIKILEKKHILKENKVKYVKTERNILCKCRHPNIVSLFCTFSDPENLYYVLELCPNGEILTHLKKLKTFSLETTQFYVAELVNAIEYLHKKNIIHRDLKPENILLTEDMHLKLTDFGTTKELESDDVKLARSNSFVGTAEYVSPELLNEKSTCAASDLWALGVIIFQFITGRLAFHGPTQYVTFKNVASGEFEWPEQPFPEHAKDLIEKLLVINPEERLGAGQGGYDKLKAHPFFDGIDWENLPKVKPPEMKPYPDEWTFKSLRELSEQQSGSGGGGGGASSSSSSSAQTSDSVNASPVVQLNYDQKATEKWAKHLNKNEHVLKAGMVLKSRKMSVKKRQLLLTDTPRLIYIDTRADETRGQIAFSAGMRPEVKNNKVFYIKTSSRKWILEDCNKNAQLWVSAINV